MDGIVSGPNGRTRAVATSGDVDAAAGTMGSIADATATATTTADDAASDADRAARCAML